MSLPNRRASAGDAGNRPPPTYPPTTSADSQQADAPFNQVEFFVPLGRSLSQTKLQHQQRQQQHRRQVSGGGSSIESDSSNLDVDDIDDHPTSQHPPPPPGGYGAYPGGLPQNNNANYAQWQINQQAAAAAYYAQYNQYHTQQSPPQQAFGSQHGSSGSLNNPQYQRQMEQQFSQQGYPPPPSGAPLPPAHQQYQPRHHSRAGSSASGASSLAARQYAADAGEADVFAALMQGTGGQASSYGATGTRAPRSPKVWTSTAEDSRQQVAASTSSIQARVPVPRSHRRANSDSIARKQHHRSSSDSMRRGSGSGRPGHRLPTDPQRMRKRFDSSGSGGGVAAAFGGAAVTEGQPTILGLPRTSSFTRPTHRRVGSGVSIGASSVVSEASFVSIVSDIRKSTFVKVADNGQIQMHFPYENVHLIPLNRDYMNATIHRGMDPYNDKNPTHFLQPHAIGGYPIQLGHLYQVPIDHELYEAYHVKSEAITEGINPFDDGLGFDEVEGQEDKATDAFITSLYGNTDNGNGHNIKCKCDCARCVECRLKTESVLPPNYYCLAVEEEGFYRRILDEICASQQMPCGLFFCGHHEDISRPSIWIAVVVVAGLFLTMAYIAFGLQA